MNSGENWENLWVFPSREKLSSGGGAHSALGRRLQPGTGHQPGEAQQVESCSATRRQMQDRQQQAGTGPGAHIPGFSSSQTAFCKAPKVRPQARPKWELWGEPLGPTHRTASPLTCTLVFHAPATPPGVHNLHPTGQTRPSRRPPNLRESEQKRLKKTVHPAGQSRDTRAPPLQQ